MTENKLESLEMLELEPRTRAQPKVELTKENRDARRLQIELLLEKGATYRQIQEKLTCGTNIISSVAKQMARRFGDDLESNREILRSRMLAVANKSLSKMAEAVDSEDDLKALQSTFTSTYDRAVGKADQSGQAQVHISIANAFASPLSTATEAAEETEVTVDVTSEASDS